MHQDESVPLRPARVGKSTAWAVLLFALLPSLAASPAGAGDLANVKERGKLVLVCFPNQDIPFVQVNLDAMREGGLKLADMHDPAQFTGVDIDVMTGFAESLGVRLEIQALSSNFGELIPALLRKEADLIADSLTITAERRKKVDFTEPYFEGAEAIVVRSESRARQASDLEGKVCVGARGTSQLSTLKALVPKARTVEVDFPYQAYVEVSEGRADCAIAETATPVGEILRDPYPPLKIAFVLRKYQYGVAVRKGSDLLGALNAYLDGLRKSGELKRLTEQYKVDHLGWIPAAISR